MAPVSQHAALTARVTPPLRTPGNGSASWVGAGFLLRGATPRFPARPGPEPGRAWSFPA